MPQIITLPPQKYIDAINAAVTNVTARAEIYQADNSTLWKTSTDLFLVDGDVSVDQTRAERRTLNLTLDNSDRSIPIGQGGLWYDKIVKVYRGVTHPDGTSWEVKLGEFLIDNISEKNFPVDIQISGRDFTKKLMNDKFAVTTGFVRNQPVEEVVRAIALNGGIPSARLVLPTTGKSLGRDYVFDREVSRWDAIKQLADDAALDIYFDQFGSLRLVIFADPYLDVPQFTFQTGEFSNLIEYSKQLSDANLYNVIVVTGGSDDQEAVPPYTILENTNPGSPTSVANLGQKRTKFYSSSHLTTKAACDAVASKFLKVYALETYNVDLSALVTPYLEAGITVHFYDPNPAAGQPTKFLLTNFSIPLGLGEMSANVKRVTPVA